jgi:hypothetical protein
MGVSCNCSCGENTEGNNNGNRNGNNINNSNILLTQKNEDNENTFLEQIREEIKEINKDEDNKFIELDYLSQYYINQKKDKVNYSISNQILMTYKNNINPFEENVDENEDIIKIKKRIKKVEQKYEKKKIITIKPMSPFLNLTQAIHVNYNFIFELYNVITDKLDKYDFNNLEESLIIIHFNIKSDNAINKINEIKAFEKELKFKLILIAKNNNDLNIKDYLKYIGIDLKDCYILSESNSKFIKLFGLENNKYDSKCIIINQNSKISLILENDIEFLNKEFIEYYLKRE